MKAGEVVTVGSTSSGCSKAQGLAKRGILPGDVVYIHTGWGEHWRDPDTEKFYYSEGARASRTTRRASWRSNRIVAIGTRHAVHRHRCPRACSPGRAAPAEGTPPALPFADAPPHAHAGRHPPVENAKLDEMARDSVWLSCTMILPLREKGAAGVGDPPRGDRRCPTPAGKK